MSRSIAKLIATALFGSLLRAQSLPIGIDLHIAFSKAIAAPIVKIWIRTLQTLRGHVKMNCAVRLILLRPLMPVQCLAVQVFLTRRLKQDRPFERIFHLYFPDAPLPGPAL